MCSYEPMECRWFTHKYFGAMNNKDDSKEHGSHMRGEYGLPSQASNLFDFYSDRIPNTLRSLRANNEF